MAQDTSSEKIELDDLRHLARYGVVSMSKEWLTRNQVGTPDFRIQYINHKGDYFILNFMDTLVNVSVFYNASKGKSIWFLKIQTDWTVQLDSPLLFQDHTFETKGECFRFLIKLAGGKYEPKDLIRVKEIDIRKCFRPKEEKW